MYVPMYLLYLGISYRTLEGTYLGRYMEPVKNVQLVQERGQVGSYAAPRFLDALTRLSIVWFADRVPGFRKENHPLVHLVFRLAHHDAVCIELCPESPM